MRLDDLRGQDQAVTVLRRAIATRRVPHAYLFEGPPGVGKRSAAIGLAMAALKHSVPGDTLSTSLAEVERVMARGDRGIRR